MKKKGSSTKRKLPTNVRERDGKYSYRYYIPTTKFVDGEEKKSSKEMESPRFDTIQEAIDFGILIEAKKIQKKLKYTDDLTVRTWSQTWLKAYIIEREPAGNTIKSRVYGLGVLLKQFGGFALADVTASQYQDFLYKLKEEGKSRSTITTIHTAASLMFEHAKRNGLIESDPTADAVIPKEKKKARKAGEKRQVLPKFLEKDELKKFLQLARFMLTTNMWAFFIVLAYTGLRISEAAGLQWDDIDFDARTIDVNKQLYGTSVLKYSFIPPKNEQSERIVSFGDTVAKALGLLKEWQKDERLSAKKFNPKDNFVFWCPSYPGYPVQVTRVGDYMKKVLAKAELPTNLTPHSLRHTHVSLLASNPRVGLPEIQARIGHKSNSKVTELIYLHVTKNRQIKIADDFEWAINN
ncbi:tyrosine-type recombinase/integrase [Paenibacillus sp. MZ03-122A]|uniref:tyrosine-type recombinase/integrase n=1 Tax=Paenibacillus sp. MZ03-122A TaxID=2962033 RepID=UPI000FC25BAE|nr:site-specific integrase [Paenibacillus sp. MZ03-122A]